MSRQRKDNKNDSLEDFFQLDIKGGIIPNSISLNGVLTHIRISGIVKLIKKKDDGHGIVDYKKIIPFIIPSDFTIDEITTEIILHCSEGATTSKYKSIQLAKLYIDAVYVVNGGNTSINIVTHNGDAYISLDGKTKISEEEKGMIEDLEDLGTLKYIDGKSRDLGTYWNEDDEDSQDYGLFDPEDDDDY